MSTRSFHHKNRHGCLTCKQRRKKCDLQRPICGICRRLSLRCSYQSLLYSGSWRGNDGLHSVHDAANFVHSIHRALASQPRSFNTADFHLAYHFLQTDSRGYATIPGLAGLRHLDFAAVSQDYPYLLHGVLTASALYIASQEAECEAGGPGYYRQRARLHQQMALSSYRRSLGTIDAQSCQFIFGFSIILAGLQLAFCASPVFENGNDSRVSLQVESLIEIFHLMQGAVAVAREAKRWIPEWRTESTLLPIRNMLLNCESEVERDVGSALDALAAKIVLSQKYDTRLQSNDDENFQNVTVCLSALRQLRGVFRCLSKGEPDSFKAVVGWPAFVDQSFVQMIKARRPIALIILAFYGVALYTLRSAWWLQFTGSKLVLAIDCILHMDSAEEWYTFSTWTMSKVLHLGTHQFTTNGESELSLAKFQPDRWPPNSFEVAYDHICSTRSIGEEASTQTSTHPTFTEHAGSAFG